MSMGLTHNLKVVLRNGDDGWIVAEVPGLVGCVSQGRTREEALSNVREAIELCLEAGVTPRPIEVVEVDAPPGASPSGAPSGRALIGAWADEAEAADEIVESALGARTVKRLRSGEAA